MIDDHHDTSVGMIYDLEDIQDTWDDQIKKINEAYERRALQSGVYQKEYNYA